MGNTNQDDALNRELIDTIKTSWNFAGTPRDAAKQVFDDHGQSFDEELYGKALYEAGQEWNKMKKEAKSA